MVSKVVDPSKHLAGESSGMVTTACGFSPSCGWAQGTHRYKRGRMGDVGCNLNIEKMVKQQGSNLFWGSYSSRFATNTARTQGIRQRGAGLLGPTKSRLRSNLITSQLGPNLCQAPTWAQLQPNWGPTCWA